jgi:hypothetical protein
LVLDTALLRLTVNATVFDIDVTGTQTPGANDNLIRGHIHIGAPPLDAVTIRGAAAPIRFTLFEAADPLGDDPDLVITPFLDRVGGTLSAIWDGDEPAPGTVALGPLIPNILAGLAYLNFHTTQFTGGEIRGQILPEPGALALVACAMAGIYLMRRKMIGAKARV